MIYILALIITIFNIGINFFNNNVPAILGWAAAACWLIILIKKEIEE